jgi:peroxiredoxin
MAGVVNQAVTAAQGLVTPKIKEGSKIPATLLKADDPMKATVDLSSQKGKIIIVGVPGAFSPQCSDQAPGYLENAQKFSDKGDL